MTAIFYSNDGNERKGPVTKDEFIKLAISADTLVWYEGLTDWKRVQEVPELADLLPVLTVTSPTSYFSNNGSATNTDTLRSPSEGAITISRKTQRYALFGAGGVVLIFLLFKFLRGTSDHSPEREPFVQKYASTFTTKLMKATYPFSGSDPRYEVIEWLFEEGIYSIDVKTYWSGSCTIFDSPCGVGWTVHLTTTENGMFQTCELKERNECARGHQVCETAWGTVTEALRNQSLQ